MSESEDLSTYQLDNTTLWSIKTQDVPRFQDTQYDIHNSPKDVNMKLTQETDVPSGEPKSMKNDWKSVGKKGQESKQARKSIRKQDEERKTRNKKKKDSRGQNSENEDRDGRREKVNKTDPAAVTMVTAAVTVGSKSKGKSQAGGYEDVSYGQPGNYAPGAMPHNTTWKHERYTKTTERVTIPNDELQNRDMLYHHDHHQPRHPHHSHHHHHQQHHGHHRGHYHDPRAVPFPEYTMAPARDKAIWHDTPWTRLSHKRCHHKCVVVGVVIPLAVIIIALAIVYMVLYGTSSSDSDKSTISPPRRRTTEPGTLEQLSTEGEIGGFQETTVPEGWSEWSIGECTVTCGVGSFTKKRTCGGDECEQPEIVEEIKCYKGACVCSFFASNNLRIFTVAEDGSVNATFNTPGDQRSIDLSYDPLTNSLFWTNHLRQVVKNGEIILRYGEFLGGLIVDWENRYIFIAAFHKGVFKASLEGKDREFLHHDNTTECETLINIADLELLFWINNAMFRVERIGYDGSQYKTIHVIPSRYGNVSGMTVDLATNKLYWQHKEDAIIFAMPYDKSSSPKIVFAGGRGFRGEDLVICLGRLYYLDPDNGGGAVFKVGLNGRDRSRVSKGSIIKADSLYLNN